MKRAARPSLLVLTLAACVGEVGEMPGPPTPPPMVDPVVMSPDAGPPPVVVTPMPSSKVVLFDSDWSTATGSTMNALLDLSKPKPWEEQGGDVGLLSVTSSAGLDFPATMKNVYRVAYNGENSAHVQIRNGWTAPAVGEKQCFRTYVRNELPNSLGNVGASSHHPIEPDWGSCPFSWEFIMSTNANGTFDLTLLNGRATRWQDRWWHVAPLQKFQTYRLEWCFERQSTNGYLADVRIHDATGALVHDGADFENADGANLLSTPRYAFDLEPQCMDDLLVGNNGPSSWPTAAGQRIYYGGVQVCRGDWCGAY